ncbi:MAG: nucleotidyltransferase domain-containing protein [Patescibacteria group bacterium]
MPTYQAKKITRQYANILRKHGVPFAHMYLFGSHAEGKQTKESDIDIAVVVNRAGSNKKYFEKKMLLWRLTSDVDARIEPILLEKKDIETGETIMGRQVKKYGMRVV